MNDLSYGSNSRQLRVVAGALAAVLLIGVIDYVTGAEASVAPLYLVPIALSTWFVSFSSPLSTVSSTVLHAKGR